VVCRCETVHFRAIDEIFIRGTNNTAQAEPCDALALRVLLRMQD